MEAAKRSWRRSSSSGRAGRGGACAAPTPELSTGCSPRGAADGCGGGCAKLAALILWAKCVQEVNVSPWWIGEGLGGSIGREKDRVV